MAHESAKEARKGLPPDEEARQGLPHDEDVRRHVRVYINVFVALMALTLVTVAISYLPLAVPLAITVALFIAVIKGSLVAGFFMHLSNEKKIIYATLVLTVVFFFVLLFYPTFGHLGSIGEHHVPEGVSPAVH